MVENCALRIRTARTNARIFAFIAYAGQIRGAIGIDCAFRAAIRCSTHIIWQTRANGTIIVDATQGIRSAWCWHTRIDWFFANGVN